MHQRSTRAPNSGELFEEQNTFLGTYVTQDPALDRCSASADPVGNGMVEKCVIQGLAEDQIGVFEALVGFPVEFIDGGNTDLVPEDGKTWTVGAVITPVDFPNWRITVDYFSLEVTDTIGQPDSAATCFDPVNTGHALCENISRTARGDIWRITDLTSNLGTLESRGVDTHIQYSTELPESLALSGIAADLDISIYWTRLLEHDRQLDPASQPLSCAGRFGWTCEGDATVGVYSRDRTMTNLRYRSGRFGADLSWRWIAGTETVVPVAFSWANPAITAIGDENYVDLGFSFEFSDSISARFVITNLSDNGPPLLADNVWGNNTEEALYDVFGRSYALKLSAQY